MTDELKEAIANLIAGATRGSRQPTTDDFVIAEAILCLIPRKPTPSMVDAGLAAVSGFPRSTAIEAIWQAMWDSASCDTRPEGGDATEIAAPFTGGAVPSEAQADAQTSPKEYP